MRAAMNARKVLMIGLLLVISPATLQARERFTVRIPRETVESRIPRCARRLHALAEEAEQYSTPSEERQKRSTSPEEKDRQGK